MKLFESIIDIPRKSIDPEVFNEGQTLQPQIRAQILFLASQYTKYAKIKRILLIGSMLTKQWNDHSDLDITLVVEAESKDMLKTGSKHAVEQEDNDFAKGTLHPINFYLREDWDDSFADNILDVIANRMIKQAEYPSIQIQNYMDSFEHYVSSIDVTKGELERGLEDYSELLKLEQSDIVGLKTAVKLKLKEIDTAVKKLVSTYKMVHALRKLAFSKEVDPEQLKKYRARNLLPASVLWKLLQKYHYIKFLQEIDSALKMSGGEIKEPTDIEKISGAMSLEQVIDEMTGSGSAGSYEVPLNRIPVGRKKKRRRTTNLLRPLKV